MSFFCSFVATVRDHCRVELIPFSKSRSWRRLPAGAGKEPSSTGELGVSVVREKRAVATAR